MKRRSIRNKCIARETRQTDGASQKAGAEANANLQETLEDLENKKESILKRMENLKTSSGQALEDMEVGIDRALFELEKAYNTALTRSPDNA